MSVSPARLRTRHAPAHVAIVAALLACLVLLPMVRAAGEVHHAVDHVELSEREAHAHAHAHAQHSQGEEEGQQEAGTGAAADASSLLHALMHLPAVGADNPALAHFGLVTSLVAHAAGLRPGTARPGSVSSPPSLPFRPPITG